jgi:very-short-patch-repair endonuclease
LRRTQNEVEAMAWSALRGRQLYGFKFRRQYPLGDYFVDFYCAEASLVIELDGQTHVGREDEDAKRQAWLESQGLLVLRFTNQQVRDSLAEFALAVGRVCRERTQGK